MLIGPQAKIRSGPFTGEQPSYPLTASAFLKATGINLTSLYTYTDASGALVDVISGNNLSSTLGTPAYRQPVAGSTGISYDGASNTGQYANVNDPGLSSCIIGAIGTFGTVFVGTNPGIFGRISATTRRPEASIYRGASNVNWPIFRIQDTGTFTLNLADTNVNVVTPIRPILYLGQVDRANNVARFVVADSNSILLNTSSSIVGCGTLTGGISPNFFSGGGDGNVFKGGYKGSLGFYATGAQCEGTSVLVNIAKRLGFGGE